MLHRIGVSSVGYSVWISCFCNIVMPEYAWTSILVENRRIQRVVDYKSLGQVRLALSLDEKKCLPLSERFREILLKLVGMALISAKICLMPWITPFAQLPNLVLVSTIVELRRFFALVLKAYSLFLASCKVEYCKMICELMAVFHISLINQDCIHLVLYCRGWYLQTYVYQ